MIYKRDRSNNISKNGMTKQMLGSIRICTRKMPGKKLLCLLPLKAKLFFAGLISQLRELNILMNLFNRHFQLKTHLRKIGKGTDQVCRLCKEVAETAEHILCDCGAAIPPRQQYVGSVKLTPI